MANVRRPDHFVVDGSNIATEGRSQPSLEQLNEAVLSFMEDHPGAVITVVVDATFGHRIADKEVKAFDEAVANNELVTPPAGAIGRGDAFVLTIANKAGAGVLSNDSFQEFHGDYDWLFDEGRLIGGKPVPHVGWVFVARTPVRGPKSRQAVREAKGSTKSGPKSSTMSRGGEAATEAKERANSRVRARSGSQPVADVQESAPAAEPAAGGRRSGRGRGGRSAGDKQAAAQATEQATEQTQSPESVRPAPSSRGPVNDLLPFLEFVERHPTGTSCTGVVESYASHGAYARVDDVLIYIPLRLMDSPAPRSARSVLAAGEAVTAVIVGYVADRRSIDAALPHMAAAAVADAGKPADEARTKPGKRPAKKASASKTPAKKSSAKQPVADVAGALESVEPDPAEQPSPKKAAAKKSPANKAPAKQAPAKQAPAKQAPAKKAAAKQAAAKKAPAAPEPAKQAPTKRRPAKQAPAKQAATDKAPAKKAPAATAPAKKSPAKKAPAKKSPARRAPAKKASS